MKMKGMDIGQLIQVQKKLAKIVQLALFQPRCLSCQKDLVYAQESCICSDCLKTITFLRAPVCHVCGFSLPTDLSVCGQCQLERPPYQTHRSWAIYEGVLREIIIAYKYGEVMRLGKLLVQWFEEIIDDDLKSKLDGIIPVPGDRSRKRDFEPIFLIAKRLARSLQVPLLKNCLKKIKSTPPQALLSQNQRLRNLNGAFKVFNPERIAKKTVLLIDDVYTTGTTVKKCSRLLADSQAEVYALTIARSV